MLRVAETVAGRGDGVQFETIDTSLPETLAEWGIGNAVFVNARQITRGIEELGAVLDQELQVPSTEMHADGRG